MWNHFEADNGVLSVQLNVPLRMPSPVTTSEDSCIVTLVYLATLRHCRSAARFENWLNAAPLQRTICVIFLQTLSASNRLASSGNTTAVVRSVGHHSSSRKCQMQPHVVLVAPECQVPLDTQHSRNADLRPLHSCLYDSMATSCIIISLLKT
jgi:hypothetical protein